MEKLLVEPAFLRRIEKARKGSFLRSDLLFQVQDLPPAFRNDGDAGAARPGSLPLHGLVG